MKRLQRRIIPGLAILAICFGVTAVSVAASLTQGYKAKTDLPKGAVVSLTKSGSQEVEKTTTENDSLLVGVVVDAPDSLLDVQPQGSQVRISVSGDVKILASTMNGDIKAGSKLIASPLAGVAATDFPPAPGVKYVAVSSSDFNASTPGAQKTTVKQSDGSTKDVYIGLIQAKMLLGNRTPGSKDKNVLTSIGKQISGKDVSLVQVLASTAVFITTVILAGMVLQGSIRGTFISLGRNPLSRDSILTGLVRIIALSILVLAAGVIVAYVILIL